MKKLLITASAILLMALTSSVGALPGPEPSSPDFQIDILGIHDDDNDGHISEEERETFDHLPFAKSDGWDFGDRESYRCAFVEFVQNGVVQFKVEFERLEVPGQDHNYIMINDRGGRETGEGGVPQTQVDLCGMPAGAGPRVASPSVTFIPGGAILPVYKNGALLKLFGLPASPAINDETFYSVGDELGEAWMWYLEEGENPVRQVVLRVKIIPVAPGVTLTAPTPSPTPTPTPTATPSPTPPGQVCETQTFFDGTTFETEATLCHN